MAEGRTPLRHFFVSVHDEWRFEAEVMLVYDVAI